MEPLPPDPYIALGVPRDASLPAIKTAYRKLALKYHPDKAKDKGDEFHKVQTAYELIGEEEKKGKYDAEYRLHQLRRESHARFAPDIRTAAFDMRSSPGPEARFTTRGPARYEERRPPSAAHASGGTPKPYQHHDGPDYFGHVPTPKPYDDYREPNMARRTSASTRPPLREEDKRSSIKKEKASSTEKVRVEAKKQRAKDRCYDRRSKAASVASLDSDGDDDRTYVRRTRDQENTQYAYVRKKESKRSDDDFDDSRRSHAYESAQKSRARDYISRSKADGPPVDRDSAALPSRSPPLDARRPSPRADPLSERRPSAARPDLAHTASSSKGVKEKVLASENVKSRPSMSRRETSRRSPSPEGNAPKRPPSMPSYKSSPAEIKVPQSESMPRSRARTHDETYTQTEERIPPAYRRSETAPIKPSNLRYGETNPVHQDSGYSTGNSPNDELNASRPPLSKQARYVPDEDGRPQVVYREPRYTRSPSSDRDYERDRDRDRDRERERDRDRDKARDKERERPSTSTKERERSSRAVPPSRSASYAHYEAARGSDGEYTSPAFRRTSRDESGRRPPIQRSDSKTGSARKVPDLPRGATMPLPVRMASGLGDAKDGFFYREMRGSHSPVDDYDDDVRPRRGSPLDDGTGGRPSRRYFHEIDNDGYGPPPVQPFSRRNSEDVAHKMENARRYMESQPGRRQEQYV